MSECSPRSRVPLAAHHAATPTSAPLIAVKNTGTDGHGRCAHAQRRSDLEAVTISGIIVCVYLCCALSSVEW